MDMSADMIRNIFWILEVRSVAAVRQKLITLS